MKKEFNLSEEWISEVPHNGRLYPEKKIKEFIEIIKQWCWDNNTIPMKDSKLKLAILDGGWVNVIKLHEFMDKKAGEKFK